MATESIVSSAPAPASPSPFPLLTVSSLPFPLTSFCLSALTLCYVMGMRLHAMYKKILENGLAWDAPVPRLLLLAFALEARAPSLVV